MRNKHSVFIPGHGEAVVERLSQSQIPPMARYTQRDGEWWEPWLKGVRDNRGQSEYQAAVQHSRAHIGQPLAAYASKASVKDVQDVAIPQQHLTSVNPQLTMASGARQIPVGIDDEVFATESPMDYRADVFQHWQVTGFGGKAARYCCGVDAPSIDYDITPLENRAGYYSLSWRDCWTDAAAHNYAGLVDNRRMKDALVIDGLQRVKEEIFFYGDEQVGISGLRHMNIERMVLPTPLDQMSFDDGRDTIKHIMHRPMLGRGEIGIPYTHGVVGTAWGAWLDQDPPTTASSCCDNLAKKLANTLRGMRIKQSSYMDYVGDKAGSGTDSSPALLFYNRDSRYFRRLMLMQPIWLPDHIEGGYIKRQAIIKVGSVYTTDNFAGLMVSNAFTGAC